MGATPLGQQLADILEAQRALTELAELRAVVQEQASEIKELRDRVAKAERAALLAST